MTPSPHPNRSGTPEVDTGVDLAVLGDWLEGQGLGSGSVSEARPLAGGTQNLLLRFEFGGRTLVLRRPPFDKGANGDETIRREALIVRALDDTDIPHAQVIATEESPQVLGAAFMVSEAVDGLPATGVLGGRYRSDHEWQHEIGMSMARIAARLGALDHGRLGLTHLAKPGSFLGRQVSRWQGQLESYHRYPGYEALADGAPDRVSEWLASNRPPDASPALMHGDYHAGNVLLHPARAGVAAVLDWELATIGDPLVDLAQLLVSWPDRNGRSTVSANVDPTIAPWLATSEELVAAYRERSDRDLSSLVWYEVLACFRLAAILEGSWARACAGRAPLDVGRRLRRSAERLLGRAERAIG